MSRTSRLIVGIATLICTAGFIAVGFWLPGTIIVATFTAIIAAACFFRTGRPLLVRFIGAVVFALFVWFVALSWNTPDFYRSLIGLNVIGMPAGFVAIRGEYPLWGRDAGAFRCNDDPS